MVQKPEDKEKSEINQKNSNELFSNLIAEVFEELFGYENL